jgi:hypothetical protein
MPLIYFFHTIDIHVLFDLDDFDDEMHGEDEEEEEEGGHHQQTQQVVSKIPSYNTLFIIGHSRCHRSI